MMAKKKTLETAYKPGKLDIFVTCLILWLFTWAWMLVILDAMSVESWLKSYVASGVPEVNKSTAMLRVAPEVPSKYPQTQDWSMTPRISLLRV